MTFTFPLDDCTSTSRLIPSWQGILSHDYHADMTKRQYFGTFKL
jgi:hypothetical protein